MGRGNGEDGGMSYEGFVLDVWREIVRNNPGMPLESAILAVETAKTLLGNVPPDEDPS